MSLDERDPVVAVASEGRASEVMGAVGSLGCAASRALVPEAVEGEAEFVFHGA